MVFVNVVLFMYV